MVTLDNASTQQPNFKVQTEELPHALRGECGYGRHGCNFTLFIYAFIRTLRIIIKQDGKEKILLQHRDGWV